MQDVRLAVHLVQTLLLGGKAPCLYRVFFVPAAALALVVGGVALEIFLTRKYKSKPLMVTLALTAENRSLLAKVRKAEPEFTVEREELVASSPRKLFLERTNAYNERVKQQLKEKLAEKN